MSTSSADDKTCHEMTRLYSILMRWLTSEYLLCFLAVCLSVGVIYARFLVSIAVGTLLGIGLLAMLDGQRRTSLRHEKVTLYLMGIFVIYVASILISADKSAWLSQLNIGLPYVAIPLGLFAFPKPGRKTLFRVISIFIAITVISALAISVDYAGDWQAYNEIYKQGQTIPTPILHVRYSYFVALACCLGIGLLLDGHVRSRLWSRGLLAASVFLFIFLHVLAVRTGLFACYVSIAALAVTFAVRRKAWKMAVGIFGSIVVVFLAGYAVLPSLRNKIDYMRYDLRMLTERGALPQYSDNTRVISYRHGLRAFSRNPVIGTGMGDLAADIEAIYMAETPQFPSERRYLPESDYLYWLAAFGLVGTVLLLGLLLYPLGMYWKMSYAMVALYAVTLASSFGVTTIQLQLGKSVFLFLLCVIFHHCRGRMVTQPVVTPRGSV